MASRMPRGSKRAPAVATGSASHIRAGLSVAPVIPAQTAMTTGETDQPTVDHSSGWRALRSRRSTSAKAPSVATTGIRTRKPIHGPDARTASARMPNAWWRTRLSRASMSRSRSRRS